MPIPQLIEMLATLQRAVVRTTWCEGQLAGERVLQDLVPRILEYQPETFRETLFRNTLLQSQQIEL